MTILDRIRQVVEPEFRLYEQEFEQIVRTDNSLLNSVVSHLTSFRGKQLRPLLTLLCAKLCSSVNDKTITSAVALELIHTASLIHDDVVDSSDMRRGKESVNHRWNNKVAVLAGDFLLSRALHSITDLRNIQVMQAILSMAEQLATGELSEMHYGSSMWISEEQYLGIVRDKTSSLFSTCALVGAITAGGSQRQQTALRNFGETLGICFQLKDDELDYSDPDLIGKPTMSDISDNKATLPLLIAMQRADRADAERIRALVEEHTDPKTQLVELPSEAREEIKSFVLRYDGLRYSKQKMEQLRERALSSLTTVFRPCPPLQALQDILAYSIARVY